MALRAFLTSLLILMSAAPANADSSGRSLASYYERHMALEGDVAWG